MPFPIKTVMEEHQVWKKGRKGKGTGKREGRGKKGKGKGIE